MPTRYRQLHNVVGVYAGPNIPESGHYSDYNNERTNNPQLSIFDHNLLQQIDRINSFSYGLSIDRTNVTQLGLRGLVNNYIVNRPDIEVRLNYWMVGVRNENRLGFVVNYPDVAGNAIYGTGQHCFIKNFTGYNTDCRNLFVAVSPDNEDLNSRINDQFTSYRGTTGINPSGLFVFGFGNCYISYYGMRAAVGELPQASVSYICDNVMGYSSGSGVNVPTVFPKSGTLVSGINFTIPRAYSFPSPSVIRPSDITLKMGRISGATITELSEILFGVNSSGLPIQSMDMSISLDREKLRSIGYVLPIDRRLNFPVFAEINISSIIANNYSGSLVDIFHQNRNYDLQVNMYNPGCSPLNTRAIAIQYNIKGAKFEKLSYSYDINKNLIGNFGFKSEIDIDNPCKGIFVSGLLNDINPEFPYNFLVLETGGTGFLETQLYNLIIQSENQVIV